MQIARHTRFCNIWDIVISEMTITRRSGSATERKTKTKKTATNPSLDQGWSAFEEKKASRGDNVVVVVVVLVVVVVVVVVADVVVVVLVLVVVVVVVVVADEFDWDADVDLYFDKNDYPLWGRGIETTWKMLMRLIVTLIIFVDVAVVLQEELQLHGRCWRGATLQ